MGILVDEYGHKGGHTEDLSDDITSFPLDNGLFDILDRQHLSRILDEHSLSEGGILDDVPVADIGRFTGSVVLVFGLIRRPIIILKK